MNSSLTIEDIVLRKTRQQRGIEQLRSSLPADFCQRAAESLYQCIGKGPVVITTGFYIKRAGRPETDGPPGALALAQSLIDLGLPFYFITDRYTAPLLEGVLRARPRAHVFLDRILTFPLQGEFPLSNGMNVEEYARNLLSEIRPSMLISIERCGRTAKGIYLNMVGHNISDSTAPIDELFLHHNTTIGIGDGGNEIGMGSYASVIPFLEPLPKEPCVVGTSHLIIASISNWGAYGLVAAASRRAGRDLLPPANEEVKLIHELVDLGAVDGVTGTHQPLVDGEPAEEQARVLVDLHSLLATEGISA